MKIFILFNIINKNIFTFYDINFKLKNKHEKIFFYLFYLFFANYANVRRQNTFSDISFV